MNTLAQRTAALRRRLGPSFDIVFRSIQIQKIQAEMIFLSSLTDARLLTAITESFVISAKDGLQVTLYPGAVEQIWDEEAAITSLMSGQCMVMLEGDACWYCVEVRSYPSRPSAEPSVERSIRGSHDGFVENIILNVGMIRRRIRDTDLRFTLVRKGKHTSCDVVYCYIASLADPDVLADFEQRIQKQDDTEIFSERNLCEALYGKTWNPYPHVRYTERPDICAIHLLKGYIVCLVDNNPGAMILPTTFIEQSKQVEEFTQTTMVALITRIVRMLGMAVSLYLLPVWIVLSMNHNRTFLNIPLIDDLDPISFGVQILIVDLVVEWIRQALIHTPTILSSIMSFIAVFALGDMAISIGAYSKEILIMVAISNIGILLTPGYELSLANKWMRVMISLFALFGGVAGLSIGILIHFTLLLGTETIKYPYLYPLIPFSARECKHILLGGPVHVSDEQRRKKSRSFSRKHARRSK